MINYMLFGLYRPIDGSWDNPAYVFDKFSFLEVLCPKIDLKQLLNLR